MLLKMLLIQFAPLEFEDHRPLYDWVIENINLDCRPKQIEFARLDLSFTITSKRKLLTLINEKKVNGWDDPRLPTLKGLKEEDLIHQY